MEVSRRIETFVNGIQPVRIRSKHKAHISRFSEYYDTERPDISRRDAKYLLFGGEKTKGLLATCGNTNLKTIVSLKRSAMMALRLVHTLLTQEPNSHRFRNILAEAKDASVFREMKLHRHINRFNNVIAFEVMGDVLAKNPSYTVETILGKDKAMREAAQKYIIWDLERKKRLKEQRKRERKRIPTSWADVDPTKLILDPSDDDEQRPHDLTGHDSSSEDEVSDPLSILSENAIRMRLASSAATMHTNATKRPYATTTPGVLTGSIKTTRPDFDPSLFLTSMHSDQSYSDLTTGLTNLQRSVDDRLLHMRKLVKQHFNEFVACKDIVDGIHSHFKPEILRSGTGREVSRTARIQTAIDALQRTADTVFRVLLERKQRGDRIRGAIATLRRFRFFFSLPGSIKSHIQRGQYAEMSRLYERAKSFKLNVKAAPILGSVLEAVENIVRTFRRALLRKLENPYASVAVQSRIVSLLQKLRCEVDPAWHHMAYRAQWIVATLHGWYADHKRSVGLRSSASRRSSAHNLTHTVTLDKGSRLEEKSSRRKQLPRHKPMLALSAATEMDVLLQNDEAVLGLVEKMSSFLTKRMAEFSRLTLRVEKPTPHQRAQFTAFLKESVVHPDMRSSSVQDLKATLQRESVSDLYFAVQRSHSQIIRECVFPRGRPERSPWALGASNASSQQHLSAPSEPAAFAESQHSQMNVSMLPSMHRVVTAITREFAALQRENINPEFLSELRLLVDDTVKYFVRNKYREVLVQIPHLAVQGSETHQGIHQRCVDPNVTPMAKRFEFIAFDTLKSIQQALPHRDKPKWMVELMAAPFFESLRAFADALHVVMFVRESADVILAARQVPSSDSNPPQRTFGKSEHRRILYAIKSARCAVETVLPSLWESFRRSVPRHYQSALSVEYNSVKRLYDNLIRMGTNAYTREKILVLTRIVSGGITTCGVDWTVPRPVRRVRDYVLDLLLTLVLAFNDLRSMPDGRIGRAVLKKLLLGLVDTFGNTLKFVDGMCSSGALQILVELLLVKTILAPYTTPTTEEAFISLCTRLEARLGNDSARARARNHTRAILKHTVASTAVMFACFGPADKTLFVSLGRLHDRPRG